MEPITLARRWRDGVLLFRRKFEATWFAYFEHLELTADYLTEPVLINDRTFRPAFWIREWHAFVYVMPISFAPNQDHRNIHAEAEELSRIAPQFDVMVAVGKPDDFYTTIKLHSAKFREFTQSWDCSRTTVINNWTIAGTLDKEEQTAYYWILISADSFGYIPGARRWFHACTCNRPQCTLCGRYVNFMPEDFYGTAFDINFHRHLPADSRKERKISRSRADASPSRICNSGE
jgi:hypothetical protein